MRSKAEASRMSSYRRYVYLWLMIALAPSVSASDEPRQGGSDDGGDGNRGVTLVGDRSSQPSVPLLIKREDQYHAKPSQHVPTDYSFVQTRPHVEHAAQKSKNYQPDIYMLEPDIQNNIYPTDTPQPKDKINIAPLPTSNKDIYSLETENENQNYYFKIKERPAHKFDNFRVNGNLFAALHAYHPYLQQDEEIDELNFATSSLGNIRNVLGIESKLQTDEQGGQRLKETKTHDFLLKRKRRQASLKRHRRHAKERQQQRVHSRSISSDGGYYYNNPYSDQSVPALWQQQVQQQRQQNSWQQNYPQYQYPSNDVLNLNCWVNNNQNNNYNRLQPVWIPVLAVPQSHFPFYVPQHYPQQPNTPRPDVNVPDTGNRFGDVDDKPIWDVVGEPATTRRPQSNRPPNRPASRPPPPPPLIHNSEKQNTPPNQNNQPGGNRRAPPNNPPVDNTITQNVDSPPRCVWAIVACCTPMSTAVRYNCFEQLGCTGAFWDVSPCSTPFARAAIRRAQAFYNQQEELAG